MEKYPQFKIIGKVSEEEKTKTKERLEGHFNKDHLNHGTEAEKDRA